MYTERSESEIFAHFYLIILKSLRPMEKVIWIKIAFLYVCSKHFCSTYSQEFHAVKREMLVETHIGLHVNHSLFCSILIHAEKVSHKSFWLFSSCYVRPDNYKHKTDMTSLIVLLLNFSFWTRQNQIPFKSLMNLRRKKMLTGVKIVRIEINKL
jgi:hypothetical protein